MSIRSLSLNTRVPITLEQPSTAGLDRAQELGQVGRVADLGGAGGAIDIPGNFDELCMSYGKCVGIVTAGGAVLGGIIVGAVGTAAAGPLGAAGGIKEGAEAGALAAAAVAALLCPDDAQPPPPPTPPPAPPQDLGPIDAGVPDQGPPPDQGPQPGGNQSQPGDNQSKPGGSSGPNQCSEDDNQSVPPEDDDGDGDDGDETPVPDSDGGVGPKSRPWELLARPTDDGGGPVNPVSNIASLILANGMIRG